MRKLPIIAITGALFVMLAGCDEVKASDSAVTSILEGQIADSLEENQTVALEESIVVRENSETENQPINVETPEDNNQESVASSTESKEELQVIEPMAEEPIIVEPAYKDIVVGEVIADSIITVGRYEQDNNVDNGPEPIEWRVLKVSDGNATLIPIKCLMWGSAEDADTKPVEFYSEAFTDNEKDLIVEFHNLLTSELLDEFAVRNEDVKDQTAYSCYLQNYRFECMANYTESVIAQGAAPSDVTEPNGYHHVNYHVWSEKAWMIWSNSDTGVAWISEGLLWSRYSSPMHRGICPYVLIKTEEENN